MTSLERRNARSNKVKGGEKKKEVVIVLVIKV